ncbi:MAG TPA: c-type cytochrome [Verrucomicrobiae bacterium]|nr:c-type cytochrome [Verrucomicrobiae bacterium]
MWKSLFRGGASVLLALTIFAAPGAIDDQTATQIEALSRLQGVDLESNAALKGAVLKVLEKTRGTSHFVDLVRDFRLKGHGPELLHYALRNPRETAGIEAFRLAVAELGVSALETVLAGEEGSAAVQLIGNSNDKQLEAILRRLAEDSQKPPALRKEAVKALARTQEGARFLLELAREGKLGSDVKLTTSSELNLAPWPDIKKQALELLPLPQTQNAEPLPSITELMRRSGDSRRGQQVFESTTSACSSCHQVKGRGTEVGPNLSEIGTKLGKDALYESILDPSAGISFGFEAWNIELKNGDEAFGLITSETADEIAVKAQTGVTTKYKKAEIAKRQKLTTSIMPAGLQLTMSTPDLIDVVEYLASLKAPPKN